MAKRAARRRDYEAEARERQVAADQGSIAAKLDALPPQDLEAERAVLGGCLLANDVIDDVEALLTPEMFYADANRRIADALFDMHHAGIPVDVLTLGKELEKRDDLEQIGGPAYLLQVLETVPHAAHSEHYAQIVRGCWRRRELIDACTETLREAFSPASDGDALWEAAEARLFAKADAQSATAAEGEMIGTILEGAFQALWERQETHVIPGVTTGWEGLDALLGALRNANLNVLAARPSMGKTAWMCNLMLNVALRGDGVLCFSLEQSKLELAERLLCMLGRINSHNLSTGHLEASEIDSLNEAASRMQSLPLFIDDRGNLSMSKISATVRRQIRRMGNVKLIVIDYIQLIEMDGRHEFREKAIAEVTRRLKFLAKDTGLPILALAQLNRGVENREDKRPRLSDLRESGAIEQDADVVMFIHRPDVYDPGDRPNEADIIVAKHRGGPIGDAHLVWMREHMRFGDKVVIAGHVQKQLQGF